MNARLAAQVTCILPAPPEVVYDEWVDVEAFRQWMCPLPARPLAIDIDPRVGGRLRIDIQEPGRRFYVLGRYLVLDRPKRISFTWSCSTWLNPILSRGLSTPGPLMRAWSTCDSNPMVKPRPG